MRREEEEEEEEEAEIKMSETVGEEAVNVNGAKCGSLEDAVMDTKVGTRERL